VAVFLAAWAVEGCDVKRGGPTCCECSSLSNGCFLGGTVRDPDGLGDCESACEDFDCGPQSAALIEECGTTVPPPTEESVDAAARKRFMSTCAEAGSPICVFPLIGAVLSESTGSCATSEPVEPVSTCVIAGVVHLLERGCVVSATLGQDGALSGSCDYQTEITKDGFRSTSYSFRGLLANDRLSGTRRLFYRHSGASVSLGECGSSYDVTYASGSCR
jgi:hypothetical protein